MHQAETSATPDSAAAPALRLCFCNSARSWGGGELWHLTFAREMRSRGWETHVLAADRSALARRCLEAGLPVTLHPLGRLSFANPWRLWRLYRFFRKLRPHAVVLGLPQDLKAAGQMARLAGCPLVIYRRGMGLPVRDTAFNRHLYRNVAHEVIVNARDTRRALLAANPELLPHERIHLLRNGVPEALLARTPGHPPEDAPCIIGTAGRLVEQKGHRYLLKAAALLQQQGLDFELRIAGEGPLQDELQRLALSLGLGERARFLGFVREMHDFLHGLHVFCFPSLWEGMGNAVLEAMAAARPVTGFAVSSMPEVVRHGETGLLAPERDVDALARDLALLCRDPGLRLRLGAAGRERIRNEFLLQEQLRRFDTLLRSRLDPEEATS